MLWNSVSRLFAVLAVCVVALPLAWADTTPPPQPQQEIGTWHCKFAGVGSCPPDGLGRGPEDFWTWPYALPDEKISVTCKIVDDDFTEQCNGIYWIPWRGRWGGTFGAGLICPEGYKRVLDQCIEIDPPRDDKRCTAPAGSPVNAATGWNNQVATDWAAQAAAAAGKSTAAAPASRLELRRYYTSQPLGLFTPVASRLGIGWRTSFDAAAVWSGDLASATLIHVRLPDFDEISYVLESGVWQPRTPTEVWNGFRWFKPRADVTATLTVNATAITLREADGTRYVFNNKGQLVQIVAPDGYTQTLTYTGDLNTRVTDSNGQWLNFIYRPAGSWKGLLVTVQASDGRLIRYEYEDRSLAGFKVKYGSTTVTSQWALKAVIYNTPSASGGYSPRTDYEYLDNMYRRYLVTKVTNKPSALPSTWTTTTWTYDVKKRVTSVESTGGKSRWEYYYDDAKQQVAVTDPLQKRYIYIRQTSIEGLASLVLLRPSITSLPRSSMRPPPAARSPIEDLLCQLLGKCSCPVDEKERCSAVKEVCLELCDMALDNKALPDLQSTYFRRCVNQCLYDLACDNGNNYPDGWDQGKIGTPRPWLGSEGLLNAKGTR